MKKKYLFAENTLMLYILTLSNYVFSFLTVPYQTRILGPELYGILGFAYATMTYFQMIFDFGFTLSGTAEITQHREDKIYISKIVKGIILDKFLLFGFSAVILSLLCKYVVQIAEHKYVFIIYFFYFFMNSLIPDFLYRGMECMKPITYRTVLIKFFFTICVFCFVKEPKDYILVPIIYFIGSFIAVAYTFFDIHKRFRLTPIRIRGKEVIILLRSSMPFFISRIASTVYGATNNFLLGLIFSGQNELGYYSSADKVVTIARMGATPISDSLYPHLIKNKDYKLVKRILCILMPIIILAGIILFIEAPLFCEIVFGKEYIDAAPVLRALIPIMVIVLPSYIFGFPMMTSLGIERHANYSVIFGAGVQVILLGGLFLVNSFNVVTVCIVTTCTETFVFVYRVFFVVKKLRRESK